jgi:hypothetical protein
VAGAKDLVVGLSLSFGVLTVVATIAVGCGVDAATTSGPVVSRTQTCQDLPTDPIFEGRANLLAEARSGSRVVCTLNLAAKATVLARLGLRLSCPEESTIFVPFSKTKAGWVVDSGQLPHLDNAGCVSTR